MIDVALSSCARIDILEKSLFSFIKHVKSKDGFRIIICEDKVDDPGRQKLGEEWIQDNRDYFDKIVFSDRKLTYVYCFSEILKHVESEYFFRLEDDVEFDQDIDVDVIVDWMKGQEDLSELVFKREVHSESNSYEVENNTGRKIMFADFFSVATGIFNTKNTKKIVDYSGSEQCHESSVLTPAMKKLNLKSGIIYGVNRKNALKYVGDDLGYKKGSWK